MVSAAKSDMQVVQAVTGGPPPQYPELRTIEWCTVIKEQKVNKTRHKGRSFAINDGTHNGLLAFVEEVRDNGNTVSTSSTCSIQTKGWMDVPTYQSWVQCLLGPYAAAYGNRICLLQDQFSVHLHNNSVTALNPLGIEVDYIPADYTPVLHNGQGHTQTIQAVCQRGKQCMDGGTSARG